MKIAWRTEADHLISRWFNGVQRLPYRASWMQTEVAAKTMPAPTVLDFTKLSPFGGKDWYAPQRWR